MFDIHILKTGKAFACKTKELHACINYNISCKFAYCLKKHRISICVSSLLLLTIVAAYQYTCSLGYVLGTKPCFTGIITEIHSDYIVVHSKSLREYPDGVDCYVSRDVKCKDSAKHFLLGEEINVYYSDNHQLHKTNPNNPRFRTQQSQNINATNINNKYGILNDRQNHDIKEFVLESDNQAIRNGLPHDFELYFNQVEAIILICPA